MEKFVEISLSNYFGTLEGRTFTGIATKDRDGKALFADYLKKQAVNGLVTIDVGEGRDIVSADLTDEESIVFDMVKAQWAVAEKRAQGWLIAKVFDSGLGKL